MPEKVQVYVADDITVPFDWSVCIHWAKCFNALPPQVFGVRRTVPRSQPEL